MNRLGVPGMTAAVTDINQLRDRLTANGAQVDDHLLPILAVIGGPMLAGMDLLAGLDFGATEPFDPAARLVADAGRAGPGDT